MPQTLQILVDSPGSSDEEIANFTQEINQFILNNIDECEITKPTGKINPQEKGSAEIFNSLNILFEKLDFLNIFAQCLSVYIKERRRTVNIVVTNQAGSNVTFSAENLGKDEVSNLVRQLKNLANP